MTAMSWMSRQPWTADASCVGLWAVFDFDRARGNTAARYADAVEICRYCPVLAECRSYADTVPKKSGVWAGKVYGKPGRPPTRTTTDDDVDEPGGSATQWNPTTSGGRGSARNARARSVGGSVPAAAPPTASETPRLRPVTAPAPTSGSPRRSRDRCRSSSGPAPRNPRPAESAPRCPARSRLVTDPNAAVNYAIASALAVAATRTVRRAS